MSVVTPARLGVALLLSSLALTLLIYAGSLGGPFLFDDQQNIVSNAYVHPESLSWQALRAAALAYDAFPGRPVSTISFALSYWISGLNPTAFKAANLLVHLLCGLTLFALARALLRAARDLGATQLNESEQRFAAAFGTAVWLLHPLQVSTVLYAVQRMAMLAALFSFLGLFFYVQARMAQLRGETGLRSLLSASLCLVLGFLSKENGVLLPLLCGVLEAGLFRLRAARPMARNLLAAFWLGGLAMGVIALIALWPVLGHWLQNGYASREFTLTERLLTQPRAMVLYLRLLLLPNVGAMTLYHDDLTVSTDWLHPSDTLPAMLAVLSLAATSLFTLFSRYRLPALGMVLFFAGHLLESTVIPLEPVFEHRNYLPSAGLFFSIAVLLTTVTRGLTRPLLATAILALLALLCSQRAQLFTNPFELASFTLKHHPESLRTQLWAGDTYRGLALMQPADQREKWVSLAMPHYRKAADIDPYDAIALYQILELQAMLGQSMDAATFAELGRRLHEGPVRAGTIMAAHDFLDDIAEGRNLFPVNEALNLANYLLTNPRCAGRGRAIVLSAVATVRAEVFDDFESAITYSREATELQPQDASLWIPYAVILFKAGQMQDAEKAALSGLAVDHGPFRQTFHDILATIREQPPAGTHSN